MDNRSNMPNVEHTPQLNKKLVDGQWVYEETPQIPTMSTATSTTTSTTTTTSTGTQPKIPSNPTWHESQVLAKHNQQQCELWGLRESFDEDRDVNDKTLSNTAMKTLSKLIEEFTARLESKEEISGWAQNACAFIQNLDTCCGTDAAERLFRRIDDSEKFQKEKTQWKNRLKNTDSVVLHGKLYLLEEKVLEDIGKASWSIAKWARSKSAFRNPIELTQRAVLNWEDVKYRASSEDDEEMDPDPEKNFQDRVRNEPSKGHFRQVCLKLGAPRKRFDNTLVRLQRWTHTPSLADPEEVAAEMKLLKHHFKELQKIRAKATKSFNPFTKSVDTYMDEMLAQYHEIGQEVCKFIPEVTDFLEGENERKTACPNCASAEMSVGDLREHQKVCHPAQKEPREPEDDGIHTPERRTPSPMPSLNRSQKKVKKLPPSYHTSGSYGGPRLKSVSSSDSDSSATSMLTTSSRAKRKGKKDDLTKLFERFLEAQSDIAKVQAKSQFKPELYCSVFDPAKIKPAEMLSAYRNWRIELKDLEDAMKTVTLKETQNYKYLKGRLAGTAKELIRENNPDEKSYARAVRKLDENYWSKQLHIKDLMHKLRNIRPMAESSAALVSDFSSNVNSLMNEIMDNLGRSEENEQL